MSFLFESWWVDALAAVFTLIVFLYYYSTSTFKHWERKGVPYPTPVPLFGNIKDLALFRKPHVDVYWDIYKQFEGLPYVGFYNMRTPTLMIRDPEMVKNFIVKDFSHWHDRGIFCDEKNDPMSATLVNLTGKRWKNLRSKLTPTFSSGKIRNMIPLLDECADALVNCVRKSNSKGNVIEFREVMAQFTTDVIGSCAFGLNFNTLADPDSQFRVMGKRVFAPTRSRTLTHLLRVFFPSILTLFGLRTVSKEVTDFFVNVVKDNIHFRETNGQVRNDFMQLLMQLRKKEETDINANNTKEDPKDVVELDDTLLTAQCFIFFIAGFETSSTSLSFCLYELAINQDIQEKCRREVDALMAHIKTKGEVINYDHVQSLTYLDRVISETMRKYPPVPGLVRQCTKPYTIPGSKIHLEKGEGILIPTYALHRDPALFADPERFDPERFSEEGRKQWHPYSYLPFGEGPRICIGMRFAMIEMKLGLARLLQNFEFHETPETPKPPIKLNPKAFVLMADTGIFLEARPRQTA